jgi:hypothetical protein
VTGSFETHAPMGGGVAPAQPWHSGVCRGCQELAHCWNQPVAEVVELAGEPFLMLAFACVCQCCCPAILVTSRRHRPAG